MELPVSMERVVSQSSLASESTGRWAGKAGRIARMLGNAASLLRYQGARWVLFRCHYALKQRSGWLQRALPCGEWDPDPKVDFSDSVVGIARSLGGRPAGTEDAVERAESILAGQMSWFSRHQHAVGFPPNWFGEPWSRPRSAPDLRHWSRIDEFSAGDIKCVWEQARFGFVAPLVRAFSRTQDPRYVEAFWRSVEDWREKNPPQRGPHWKCGQEVGLRAMAWIFGLVHFFGHEATTPQRRCQMHEMLDASGRRIAANIDYALSQRNNHGVSEAAALFTLGILLDRPDWTDRGERLLRRLANELIYDDGSFSQHSTNYHRLMLHGYLWAIWFGRIADRPLEERTVQRVRKAGRWVGALLCPTSGRVPNLGTNDGAHFLDLTDLGFLDYRPVVQAVGLLTEGRAWLARGPWDELAEWLSVGTAREGGSKGEAVRRSDGLLTFPIGGYAVWHHQGSMGMLRCPTRFRHRPGQCDLLHFDLTAGGRNLLRDAGSYSYNCDEPWRSYFSSSRAHNTICVDDRDPMPKVGRFLYGHWPVGEVETHGQTVAATYRDYRGIRHRRTVSPTAEGFRIEDTIEGAFTSATLRWRLDPGLNWTLTPTGCRSTRLAVEVVTASGNSVTGLRLADGAESLYYLERSPLPVLEAKFDSNCRALVTEIRIAVGSNMDAGDSRC